MLTVCLAVCRSPKDWELAEEIARTLIEREPNNIMHTVALAEVVGRREDRITAAAGFVELEQRGQGC